MSISTSFGSDMARALPPCACELRPATDGGHLSYGARRAIRYGDGWIPTARGDVAEVLPKFRDMAREAGRDPASIEITSFGLGDDLDRVKRLAEAGSRASCRLMALEIDDMRTKGVDLVWGPRLRETYSRAEICDPNGFHIELRQWFR